MKEIKLTQGKIALVDDEDFEYINQFKWHVGSKISPYAYANIKNDNKRTTIAMHRLITNCPKGLGVDHKNRDRLDNRKVNLRICKQSDNVKNRTACGSSKYLGVTFLKTKRKYILKTTNEERIYISYRIRARITVNKKEKHLGTFYSEIEAAKAYDEAAKKYHGKFANLNFK